MDGGQPPHITANPGRLRRRTPALRRYVADRGESLAADPKPWVGSLRHHLRSRFHGGRRARPHRPHLWAGDHFRRRTPGNCSTRSAARCRHRSTGEVVATRGGEPDHVARRLLPALIPYSLTQGRRIRQGIGAITGNHVIIRDRDTGRFVGLMHLKLGSLSVAQGDRVRVGDRPGRVETPGSRRSPTCTFRPCPALISTRLAGFLCDSWSFASGSGVRAGPVKVVPVPTPSRARSSLGLAGHYDVVDAVGAGRIRLSGLVVLSQPASYRKSPPPMVDRNAR